MIKLLSPSTLQRRGRQGFIAIAFALFAAAWIPGVHGSDVAWERAEKYGLSTKVTQDQTTVFVDFTNPTAERGIEVSFSLKWTTSAVGGRFMEYTTRDNYLAVVPPLGTFRVAVPRPFNLPDNVGGPSVVYERVTAVPLAKAPPPSRLPLPVTQNASGVLRKLTNQQGQEIDAELLRLEGDQLVVKSSGRQYRVPVSTLSLDDQAFIKEWSRKGSQSQLPGMAGPPGGAAPRPGVIPPSAPIRGGDVESVAPSGSRLVGIRYWKANMDSVPIMVIRGLQPIFEGPAGRVDGKILGAPVGEIWTEEARPGYAVAGMETFRGLALDRFKLRYCSLAPGGEGYESDWHGGRGGERHAILGGDGTTVLGVFGIAGMGSLKVGLIYEGNQRSRPTDTETIPQKR